MFLRNVFICLPNLCAVNISSGLSPACYFERIIIYLFMHVCIFVYNFSYSFKFIYLFKIYFRSCLNKYMMRNFDLVKDFLKLILPSLILIFYLLYYGTDTSATSCRYQSTQQEHFIQ